MAIQSLTSAPAAALSSAPQGSLREAVSIAVLKKAMDLESQAALTLVSSAAKAAPALPANVGTRFNASA